MNVAIVGSRKYPYLDQVEEYVSHLPSYVTVVSGGARGVDSVAENAARSRGLECIIFKPDWQRLGKAAGFIRNKDIVKISELVVVFWDGKSNGTRNTLQHCENTNTPVDLYINGEQVEEWEI